MGNFVGHVLPGLGFLLLGLWHLLNTITRHAHAPSTFQTSPWFPATRLPKLLRRLELHAIILASCLSIASELFIGPHRHQPLAPDWSIPSNHLHNFEHSTISLFFLIYAIVALCADAYHLPLPQGLLHLLAALAFSQELLLFHLHSADHMGLEGHYHWLLQLVVATSLATTLLELVWNHSFLATLTRSMSILLQGLWLLQMGLVLWDPSFTPKGCRMNLEDDHYVVRCPEEASRMRAEALANLQFSWHLAGLVVFTVLAYTAVAMHYRTQARYELVHEGEELLDGSPKDLELGSKNRRSRDGSHISMEELPALDLER